MGEEWRSCFGITDNGKSCRQPLKGASYCRDHGYQECKDVEMSDVDGGSCRQSTDVEMGGM